MDISDEYEEKIVNKIENIHQLELEALRRAGVAKEKEQGLEIESTEAVRLFREATGYILRLRELREDMVRDVQTSIYVHPQRILGYIDDYNRILKDLKSQPTFKSCVSGYEKLEYEQTFNLGSPNWKIEIEGRADTIPADHTSEKMQGLNVQRFVIPRLERLTKDVENSLIGRCASGKRPG